MNSKLVITRNFVTPALILASAAILHEWLANFRESVHSATKKQFAVGNAFERQYPQLTLLVPNANLGITVRECRAGDV